MQKSTNYGLNLPDLADQFNLNHWNENTEKLDLELKKETDSRINNDNQLQSNINNSVSTLRNEISTAETNAKNLENATGVLPIAKGGTGATTQTQINKNIATEIETFEVIPTDTSLFVMKDTVESDAPLFARTVLNIWEYIKTKISSVLGLTATQYNGNAKTATRLATTRTINIQDASATNTGTGASFDGSGNATIKLPSTIKANITGNCSGSSGSCTGNSATSTKATNDLNGNAITSYTKSPSLTTNIVTTQSGAKPIPNQTSTYKHLNLLLKKTDGNSTTTNMPDVNILQSAYSSSSGYVKFANGLIIQWGKLQLTTASAKEDKFPIEFTSLPTFTLVPVRYDDTGTPQGDMRTRKLTTQGFKCSITNDEAYTIHSYAHWIAIGY